MLLDRQSASLLQLQHHSLELHGQHQKAHDEELLDADAAHVDMDAVHLLIVRTSGHKAADHLNNKRCDV